MYGTSAAVVKTVCTLWSKEYLALKTYLEIHLAQYIFSSCGGLAHTYHQVWSIVLVSAPQNLDNG